MKFKNKLLDMFSLMRFIRLLLLNNSIEEGALVLLRKAKIIETEKLLADATPKNTRKVTDMWVSAFHSFCPAEEEHLDLATCS